MGKIKRIFDILFNNDLQVTRIVPTDEIGFGPALGGTDDKRKQFDKDVLKKELVVPPVKIEKGKLSVKILEVRRIIYSLQKKGMDVSRYTEAKEQLLNRKRYTIAIEQTLSTYPITTLTKIQDLSEEYKLVFKNLNGVTRDIPLNAVKAIEKFCKPLEKARITYTKNNFFLIAPEDWWQKKRDPILLAKSPFGNYYYILYAWDKEVDIVEELFEE